MLETFIKIRTIISFIQEEINRIDGSEKIKNEVLFVCNNISDVLHGIGEVESVKIIDGIKRELDVLDRIVDEIEKDKDNNQLYFLLITHIADIRFLFLTEDEQKKILSKFKK